MGERRELQKTQFDQRWETFVERCVCVCVCVCVIIKKKAQWWGDWPPPLWVTGPPPIFYSPSA